jgi:hypothetical protein
MATQSFRVLALNTLLGLQMYMLYGSNKSELDLAVATAAQQHAGALFVGADALATIHRNALIAQAPRAPGD